MEKYFYGVIVEKSYRTEGDERSRTHAGHGYPAETVTYKELITFDSEEGLTAWIRKNNDANYGGIPSSKLEIIKFQKLKVEKTVSFSIKQN